MAISYHNVMQTLDSNSIQVISRAIAVLKACEKLGPGQSLGGLAQAVGLPRSTVQRIVQSLMEGGFLVSNGKSRSIALGPDLLAMGANITATVVEVTQPFLKTLAQETGETVDLARFNEDHMVFINQVPGAHRLQAVSAVGDNFPLHCTANGKAALSLLDEVQIATLLSRPLPGFTRHTITDGAKLRTELEHIRTTGIAVDHEEHTLGISAVGAAFRDTAQQIYAISIPIPAVRFAGMRQRCETLLAATVASITQSLQTGGRVPRRK